MESEFYDVKAREKVKAEVIGKVTYDNGRHAFKAKTKDGRSLTRFVSAADYAKAKGVKEIKGTATKAKKATKAAKGK